MQTKVFEKLKTYRYLFSKYEDFRNVIKQYSGHLNPEYCLIDFKIHEMKIGEIPCRPIWHYDGTNNPSIDPKTDYCLYLSGTCQSQTKFFITEPPLLNATESEIHKYALSMEKDNPTYHIPYNRWNHYTSENLHAAVKAKTSGTRLLIRLKNIKSNHCDYNFHPSPPNWSRE